MKLNELAPKEGSVKGRMRVGRGIGSGKGKTSAKGQKGQKARSGVAIKGFEGGQMPLYQRLPKRGFTSRIDNNYAELNLAKLQQFIDAKKVDTKGTIDEDALVASGVIRRKLDGVRLLGNGELTSKVTLNITGATKSAIAAVEKAGGKVEILDKSVAPVVRKKPKSDGTL
jgi:large subunit ribosomal protein L15